MVRFGIHLRKSRPQFFEFGHGMRRESRTTLSFGGRVGDQYMGIGKATQHQGLVSETFILRTLIDIKVGHLSLCILERPEAELGTVDCSTAVTRPCSLLSVPPNVSYSPASGPLRYT